MNSYPPYRSDTVSFVGIDPGSEKLGASVIGIDVETQEISFIRAGTFAGSKMFSPKDHFAVVQGDRQARFAAHLENLYRFFLRERPVQICSESPFYNPRMPAAFGSLTELISTIRKAALLYSPERPLYLIDPPSVKKAVGASGAADKDAVRKCVLALLGKYYIGQVPMEDLDEHSIDAIAVGYARYKLFFNTPF